MTSRREMTVTLGAVAVGAGLALLAAGRPRMSLDVPGGQVSASGATTPAATALALVALAGAGALLLLRGWARSVVGVLLLGAAAGIVAAFLIRPEHTWFAYTGGSDAIPTPHRSAWAWLGVTGGLVLGAAALVTAWRGRGWPAPRRRYDAPTGDGGPGGARPRPPRDAWEALDRGEDPTA